MRNLTKSALAVLALASAAMSATAQEDLLAGKPIHTLGDAKTWTAGDASYTFITEDLAKLVATPTNTDNVYLYPENGTLNTPENQALGMQAFYVDMQASHEVSIVNTTWEGAAASAYNIYLTDEEPTLDIPRLSTRQAAWASTRQTPLSFPKARKAVISCFKEQMPPTGAGV